MNHNRKEKLVRNTFYAASVIFPLAFILMTIGQIIFPEKNFGPALALLAALSPIVPAVGRWLIGILNKNIEEEKVTLPYALAYGYLNNYLAPVLRKLRKESVLPSSISFYVYIPRFIGELKRDSIDEILSELENNNYKVETLELDFPSQRRSKDYRTARKSLDSKESEIKYFDFPTTILTLEQIVKYKLETLEDNLSTKQEKLLGETYITAFRNHLKDLLKDHSYDSIRNNIHIVEGGIDFLEKNNKIN